MVHANLFVKFRICKILPTFHLYQLIGFLGGKLLQCFSLDRVGKLSYLLCMLISEYTKKFRCGNL